MRSAENYKQSIRLPLFFAALASLFILIWVLKYSRYGIDFTDESFYLIWIENPFQYEASVSQFGFILHPLHILLNGSVAGLRQANSVITYGLAFALSYVILGMKAEHLLSKATRIVTSAGFATASFALFGIWIVTPNYNSLNLQALLIATIGVACASSPASRNQMVGLVLIGFGGWLSFMVKPSSAFALGILVIAYWVASGRWRVSTFLIPVVVCCVLLLLSAYAIDGSVGQFVRRISMGLDVGRMMDGGHTIDKLLRLDDFFLTQHEKILLAIAILLPAGCFISLQANRLPYRWMGTIGSALAFLLVLLVTLDLAPTFAHFSEYRGLLLMSALGTSLIYLAIGAARGCSVDVSRDDIALAAFMLLLPYCFAFGTNGNYWWAAAFAGFFWLLPALILITSIRGDFSVSSSLTMLALSTQVIAVLLLQTGMNAPYRQTQPLQLNERATTFGRSNSTLVLSAPFADYLKAATNAAGAADLKPGTPMIDLTGRSPGILYALQSESVGQAWMIGGYPGSLRLANHALRSVPCEKLASAWLLTEQRGPRSLPASLLLGFGADMVTDYKQVGSWKTAPGSGGYREQYEQSIWQPVRSLAHATADCQASRERIGE